MISDKISHIFCIHIHWKSQNWAILTNCDWLTFKDSTVLYAHVLSLKNLEVFWIMITWKLKKSSTLKIESLIDSAISSCQCFNFQESDFIVNYVYHMLQVAQMKGIKLCVRKLTSWPMGNNERGITRCHWWSNWWRNYSTNTNWDFE